MGSLVLYAHRRNDDNSIFYIGIGTPKRPYSNRDRNNYWRNIVKKYGRSVEILKTGLSREEAFLWEKALIKLLGREDQGTGRLVNLTDGGDGNNSWKPDDQWKERQRRAKIGKPRSEEIKSKISQTKKGVKRVNYCGEKHPQFGKKCPEISERMSKKCINVETGEIAKSVIHLSQLTGFKYSTLVNWLNGRNRKPVNFNWQYKYN
jgi:hypothetical protein